MFAYVIQNENNGKVYIGKTNLTVEKRWYNHLWLAEHGRGYAIHNAIRKHSPQSFTVTEAGSATTEKELIELEKLLIAIFRSDSSQYGYNLTPGGEGGTFNEEARRKLSVAMRGRKYPDRNRKGIPRPNMRGDKHPLWGTHPIAWNKGIKTGPNPKHSEFMKGRTPWNKGKKTGQKNNLKEWQTKNGAWNKGKTMPDSFREQCRQREARIHPKQLELNLQKSKRKLEDVLSMVSLGMTYTAIAHHYGVSRSTINTQLIKAGISVRWKELSQEEILELRNSGLSFKNIGKRLGVSKQTVIRRFRRAA